MTEGTGPTPDSLPSDPMSRDHPPAEVGQGGEGGDRGGVPDEVYEDGLESGADEPSGSAGA